MNMSALIKHWGEYPRLQVQDLFKFLFQSAFGCEHMAPHWFTALDYVRREYYGRVDPSAEPRVDRLAGEYSRVHLSWLSQGLSPETLTGLFVLSAKTESEGKERLEGMLAAAREMIQMGEIPLDPHEFEEKLEAWRAMGYPAIHHSEVFREAYAPAYRVIANRYANFLPLFAKLDTLLKDGPVILAIEGGSASGKSTLTEAFPSIYGCGVIHTDDFFLRPEQRTAERLSEVGGNLDRERFMEEVLPSLTRGEAVQYRPFDCGTQTLSPPVTVKKSQLTVVEGVYATHPAFGKYYDLAVFLDISPEQQRARIVKRNPPFLAERFFGEWIPLENQYFERTAIRDRADLCIPVWEE